MKKLLFFVLVLLVSTMALFAAPTEGTLGKEVVSLGEVPVTFDLSKGTTYYVGFATETTNIESGDVSGIKDTNAITLKLDDTKSKGILDGNLYVYWVVSGGQPLKIELEAGGALSGETESENINWKTTWGDKSLGGNKVYSDGSEVLETAYTNEQIVFDRTTVKQAVERGYAQLSIETQDVSEVVPDSYVGSLQLIITPIV